MKMMDNQVSRMPSFVRGIFHSATEHIAAEMAQDDEAHADEGLHNLFVSRDEAFSKLFERFVFHLVSQDDGSSARNGSGGHRNGEKGILGSGEEVVSGWMRIREMNLC